MVGEFYMKKQSFNAAIGRFEGLLKTVPDYKQKERVLLALGIAYKKAGEHEKSEETLKSLLREYPSSPLAAEARKVLSSLQAVSK